MKEGGDEIIREEFQAARKNEKWRVLDIRWMFVKHRPKRSGEGLYDITDALSGKV